MTDTPSLVEVHIREMPLETYREAAEHSDELQREFALIREGEGSTSGNHDVPRRLLALMAELGERFSGFTIEQESQLDAALERGEATIDLVYRVPPSVRQAVIDLGTLLDEADEFCRQGDLLTLATPPRALAFRRWLFEEFIRQTDGLAPRTWQEFCTA